MQWNTKDKEDNNWVILESNLLPPTAVAQMDELVTWIRASQKKINPLVYSVLKHDTQLQMSVIETCNEWGTQRKNETNKR